MILENKRVLENIISKDRLDGYFRSVRQHKGSCDLFDAYLYYSWNIRLSECFYASLQALEIALRNSIQNAANRHFHNSMWFDDSSILRLNERKHVESAKVNLRRQQKHVDPGRIVAELNLGFWTSLFYAYYENILWRPLIKNTFPSMHPSVRKRKTLSKRLNKIRKFRNRAFHYEPIWYFNLAVRHAEILEVIDWIEPAIGELLKPVDRFPICSTPESFAELKESLQEIL